MKLLRTNRLNVENSWNFPLIDYFHDIVKDGNGINFQKASYTLDGCVKVYTTRVDSVVAKTSKLLSGLVGSESVRLDEDADSETNEVDEDGGKPKRKRNTTKKATSCLVKPETLELNLTEMKRIVNAMHHNAAEDFDEGGTKGTRLWKETSDEQGWVGGRNGDQSQDSEVASPKPAAARVDVSFYFTTFGDISDRSVNPSAQAVDQAIADPHASTDVLVREVQGWNLGGDDAYDNFHENMSMALDGDDIDQGNEIPDLDYSKLSDVFSMADASRGPTELAEHVNWELMSYFDHRNNTGWAGPTHWRVQHYNKLKSVLGASASDAKSKPRTRKEPFMINFLGPAPDPATIFEPGKAINMTKAQQSDSPHLLPQDYKITSKQFLHLFLRPDDGPATAFTRVKPHQAPTDNDDFNADFWGQVEAEVPRYDADFYQDAGEYDIDDAPMDVPATTESQPQVDIATQFSLGPKRPDQIAFARVARNVNVHQLKTNMWDTLKSSELEAATETPLALSTVIEQTAQKYTPEKQHELSTPFYFICLLHLANEQGLQLSSTNNLQDLEIRPPSS